MMKRKLAVFLFAIAVTMSICTMPAYAAGWVQEGDEWTYEKEDGSKTIGWLQDQGKWYYFQEDGWMVTGWVPKDGKWCYLTSDGSLAVNTKIGSYSFDADGLYEPTVPTVENPGDNGHNYYKGLTEEQAAEADLHAQLLASLVLNNLANDTDLKKVKEAAQLIDLYCAKEPYEEAVGIDYRSPYGVFVTKNFTCAGETRALGRVLDFMGYSWTHAHENENVHQWVILNMDGKVGYADPQGVNVGYGQYWALTI
ncbi:cell wall-binding protein [Enterocloster clostridioformis]|uniref:cell wall-binding protein n=1 Tax=Enterocloster clostridioformis TaxID=1531 RepID=UPI0022E55E3B|nr:cell wall-binding protein [Enterocloster clostridioformis]